MDMSARLLKYNLKAPMQTTGNDHMVSGRFYNVLVPVFRIQQFILAAKGRGSPLGPQFLGKYFGSQCAPWPLSHPRPKIVGFEFSVSKKPLFLGRNFLGLHNGHSIKRTKTKEN